MSSIRGRLIASKPQRQESGVVALFVTLIMITVMSLIVLGFWQIAQRNQRQTLDRQLSNQAYYAAESGVNDAITYLKTHPNTSTSSDCTSFITLLGQPPLNTNQNLASGTKYTCLSVDTTPPVLTYGSLPVNGTVVWPLEDTSGGSFSKVTLTWTQDPAFTGTNDCDHTTQLPVQASWNCAYGLVRIDLMPAANTIDPTAFTSASGMTTVYITPRYGSGGGSSAQYHITDGNGVAVTNNCVAGTGNTCAIDLDNMSSLISKYYVRITMLYQGAGSLQLTPTLTTGGSPQLKGAQSTIDSTGQAQDVLRRIRVSIPLGGNAQIPLPESGLQTTAGICKLLTVGAGVYQSGCDSNNVSGPPAGVNIP